MTHNYYLPALGLLLSCCLNAQNPGAPCATPWFFEQSLQSPEKQALLDARETAILEYFTRHYQHPDVAAAGGVRTIPVVVHIVHNNGPENLSDAQVEQGIAWLNDALANQAHFNQNSGADTEIRLCLARRTPDNQPTNGITHTQSPLTQLSYNTQDLALKNTIRWNPEDYLNIWVVREICHSSGDCSVGGYTGSWLFHGEAQDGIVVEARTWGADIAYTPVIAHETGHYFGLYHTFQGGCTNVNCLNQGDRICDTPPDQSTASVPCGQAVNSCNTDTDSGPFTSDQPDQTLNFMDYGNFGCMHDFSADQAIRMNQILSGARASLLDSRGCRPPCPTPASAAFTSSEIAVLSGATVFFTPDDDDAAAYVWTQNGQVFSTLSTAELTFTTPGLYTIQLNVFPADTFLCEVEQSQIVVEVSCPLSAGFSTNSNSFQLNEPVLIQNTSQGQGTFEWFVNGVSQGATLDNLTFTESGEYRIELVMSNGICSSTAVQYVYASGECDYLTYTLSLKLQGLAPSENPFFQTITVLADSNLLLSGYYDSGIFLAKTTMVGGLIWVKNLSLNTSPSEIFFRMSVCATPDTGFAVILPEFGSSGLIDEKKHRSVAKFSSGGVMEWRRSLPEVNGQYFRLTTVMLTGDHHLVVCGGYQFDGLLWAKLDLDGNIIWAKQQDIATSIILHSITELPGGNLIAIGRNENTGLLLKIDPAGTVLWKKSFTTSPTLHLTPEIIYHPQENALYYHTRGDASMLIKWDTNGVKIWSKSLENVQNVLGGMWSMRLLPNGDLGFCGRYFWVNDVGAMLMRVNPEGEKIWARSYPNFDYFYDMLPLPNGGYMLVGGTYSPDNRLLITFADRGGFSGNCPVFDVAARFEPTNYGNFFHSTTTFPDPTLFQDTLSLLAPFTTALDTVCDPACNRTQEICGNGVDDDNNYLFDCLDPECDCAQAPCEPRKTNNIWYFGSRLGLDFNTDPPARLINSNMSAQSVSSTLCDEQGNLLLYSSDNGHFNRSHTPVANQVASLSSAGIIVPDPSDKTRAFFINPYSTLLPSCLIDMQLDAGQGGIVGNIFPLSTNGLSSTQRLAITRTCDNNYWIIFRFVNQQGFHAFKTDDLLSPEVIVSNVGPTSNGIFKISPDGQRIAQVTNNGAYIFDFNLNTGVVSNPVLLPYSSVNDLFNYPSLEFSPDGRYLYVEFQINDSEPYQSRLLQFDLFRQGFPSVEIPIPQGEAIAELQLAPNGKIYASDYTTPITMTADLHVIHQPNAAGVNCLYQTKAIHFPEAVNSFGYGITGPLCQTIASDYYQPRIAFYPDAPDTVCGYDTGYVYRLRLPPCTDSLVQWSLSGIAGTVSANGASALVNFSESGQGLLIAALQTECGWLSDTLRLLVGEPLNTLLDLGPDLVLCENGIATLDAGFGFSEYLWSTGSIESSITTDFPGAYWVEVSDLCGTRQSDTITVSIAPESALDLGPDLLNQCSDLTASYNRPAFFAQWNWSPADFLSCSDCPLVQIAPGANTEWIVTAQTDDGCISTDTLRITLRDTLFFTLDTFVCANRTLSFSGLELPPDTTALFFQPAFGAGCDTLLTVNVMGLETGNSSLNVTICPNEFFSYNGALLPPDTTAVFVLTGSAACDSVVTVQVNAWPTLQLSLPMDTTIRIGDEVLLEATVSGAGPFDYAWSPPEGLSCVDCSSPVAAPFDTINYQLLVTDTYGCSADQSVTVRVNDECRVRIPNAFSPNGDGANDRFQPISDPCVGAVRVWRIVNRWGETVWTRMNFDPESAELGWDGMWNGRPHPSEVLVWMLEIEYKDGRRETRSGEVTLLR